MDFRSHCYFSFGNFALSAILHDTTIGVNVHNAADEVAQVFPLWYNLQRLEPKRKSRL